MSIKSGKIVYINILHFYYRSSSNKVMWYFLKDSVAARILCRHTNFSPGLFSQSLEMCRKDECLYCRFTTHYPFLLFAHFFQLLLCLLCVFPLWHLDNIYYVAYLLCLLTFYLFSFLLVPSDSDCSTLHFSIAQFTAMANLSLRTTENYQERTYRRGCGG